MYFPGGSFNFPLNMSIFQMIEFHKITFVAPTGKKYYPRQFIFPANYFPRISIKSVTDFHGIVFFRRYQRFRALHLIISLGYGNMYPKTTLGKFFTLLYSCLGIPLMAVYLAIFSRGIYRLNTMVFL